MDLKCIILPEWSDVGQPPDSYGFGWAWQFFRTAGKIDSVNTVTKGITELGNSHRGGLPGKIATPVRPDSVAFK